MFSIKSFFAFLGLILFFALVNNVSTHIDHSPDLCGNFTYEKRDISLAGSFVRVDIADTDTKRTCGLSHRENLGENEGMLFLFEKPDYYGIWMKDMRFSIDIVWLDESFFVVHIEKNVTPESFPRVFTSPERALYVLELNAGFSENAETQKGTSVFFVR